jgi:hypothetical protein
MGWGRELCGSSGPGQGGRCRCALRPPIRLRANRANRRSGWAAEHLLCQCRLVHGDQGHAREWLGTAHAASLQVRQDGGLVAADDEHAGVEGLDLCVYSRGGWTGQVAVRLEIGLGGNHPRPRRSANGYKLLESLVLAA